MENETNGAAKLRKLDDDAREVVERLREIGDGHSSMERLIDILDALGIGGSSIVARIGALRDRLIELIECPSHDVDVAALMELADEMDAKLRAAKRRDCLSPRYNDGIRCGIGDAPERIRKAVEGAPKPDAGREAAADWVEMHGGLDRVRECERMNGYVSRLAAAIGVSDCALQGERLREAIDFQLAKIREVSSGYRALLIDIGKRLGFDDGDLPKLPEHYLGELDKRLMPCDLTWPRWDDGCPVTRDDSPNDAVGVLLALDGSYYSLFDMPDFAVDPIEQRVKRPEPEVLGADGLPIKVGDTVYAESGLELVVDKIDGTVFSGKKRIWRVDGGWWPPEELTHTLPDSQELIDSDAILSAAKYYEKYPHVKEYKYYSGIGGVAQTHKAGVWKSLDLLRRQRELDNRAGGDAQ